MCHWGSLNSTAIACLFGMRNRHAMARSAIYGMAWSLLKNTAVIRKKDQLEIYSMNIKK